MPAIGYTLARENVFSAGAISRLGGRDTMTQLAIRAGAWPILLTAFDRDKQLDLPAVGALLDFYRDLATARRAGAGASQRDAAVGSRRAPACG